MKTYGTLSYIPTTRHWAIQCEPHVSMRLKAVFQRVNKGSQGVHEVFDTPEICRDLVWFLERYPLQVNSHDRAYLWSQTKKYRDRETLMDQLLSGKLKPRPFKLAKPPRQYQQVSAEITLSAGGLLNADEVGLGKTVSGITVMTDPRARPALVVTLTHLPKQWRDELRDFAPDLTVHIIRRGKPYDLTHAINDALPDDWKGSRSLNGKVPDVIIMNYHKLSGWVETLAPIVKYVVYDEAQELRTGPEGSNGQPSLKYVAAQYLCQTTAFRKGLTATPVYNYGSEMWNVMNCIRPGSLGTREEFLREWCDGSGRKAKISDPKAFGTYLRDQGLMLRRTAEDVGRQLPGNGKPLVIPHYIDANLDALKTVTKSCEELARIILRQGEKFRGEKFEASRDFDNKLRQATGIAKAPYVADFIRLLVEQGERPVLFAWHRMFYEIVLDRLKDLNPVLYTGSESTSKKEQAKQKFIKGESPIFICSLRAGAGLNGLQFISKIVVIGELDWSPGIHHQNIGRVYRDGQEHIVRAYFLISEYGSDPAMIDVLGVKKFQSDGMLDPHADLVAKLETDPDHVKRLAASYLAQIEGRGK